MKIRSRCIDRVIALLESLTQSQPIYIYVNIHVMLFTKIYVVVNIHYIVFRHDIFCLFAT